MKWEYRRVYEISHVILVLTLNTGEVIDASKFFYLSRRLQKFLHLPVLDMENRTLTTK